MAEHFGRRKWTVWKECRFHRSTRKPVIRASVRVEVQICMKYSRQKTLREGSGSFLNNGRWGRVQGLQALMGFGGAVVRECDQRSGRVLLWGTEVWIDDTRPPSSHGSLWRRVLSLWRFVWVGLLWALLICDHYDNLLSEPLMAACCYLGDRSAVCEVISRAACRTLWLFYSVKQCLYYFEILYIPLCESRLY